MTILGRIVRFYVESHDEFNGLPLSQLLKEALLPLEELKEQLAQLVRDGLISINFGDRHPNSHVKAFVPEPIEEQLEKLEQITPHDAEEGSTDEPDIEIANADGETTRIVFRHDSQLIHVCVYPENESLLSRLDLEDFKERPFTLRLALGEPQLARENFDVAILEIYRNDPRYHYDTNDIGGTICISDEYYLSDECAESDKTLLEHFGFSYNAKHERAVAAFLRDLSRLTPEHQRIWNARLLKGEYFLHPDYQRAVSGHRPENLSIFDALLMELEIINGMCQRMGKPVLFRNNPSPSKRPREFAFLLRPTIKEYQGFIHLLDKLLSDSLNKAFFRGDIELTNEVERNDGTVETTHKGTITLLHDWVHAKVTLPDPEYFDSTIQTFRHIRKLRQPSAHSLDDNRFDRSLFEEQRELMVRVYSAIRLLRLLFTNHPAARDHPIPELLHEGKIWAF